jgi:DNA mismatch repair protein MutS
MPGDNDFDCSIAENISIRISQTITSDPFASLKNGNAIKSGVNEELDSLKTLSRDVKTYISDLENKERQETGIANLKISYNGVFGYFIELTKSNIKLAPARYIRKQTLTNAERYITQELKEFEEKILSAQEKIIRLETFIFDGLKTEIAQYCGEILKIAAKIAETDIFCSFAKNALSYNYCRPEMNESFDLEIIEGRHPVVERILKEGEFCANDVSFSEKERILLLTGPNMSGKSTYLRQTALIAIMAQIGSFVPAQSAKLGIIDRIFTRIGAGDNLAGGQSTFMVEMTETANILNQYGDRSLIILDEIGRGTSTYDGISIAQAILEYFADEKIKSNKGSKILFATHYFELTSLADKAQDMANFTVDVKEWAGEVVFLHKIIRGSADRSYGIHVAKIAGLPKKIIERAFQILEELEKTNFNGSKNEDQNQLDLFSQNQNQQAEFQNQQSAAQNASLIDFDSIDIDNLTPLQALNLLKEIKDKNQK